MMKFVTGTSVTDEFRGAQLSKYQRSPAGELMGFIVAGERG